jgi:septal ring factor EnvC (AmiA/AmiB activator)
MSGLLIALVTTATLLSPPVTRTEDLSTLLADEMDLLEAMDKLDTDKAAQEKALRENKHLKEEILRRLEAAQKGFDEARDQLHHERVTIKKRLSAYIRLKKLDTWQILASADDYTTYLRRRRLLHQLIEDDEARIRKHHKTVASFRSAKGTLELELNELRAVEGRIKLARQHLARDIAVKNALLDSVRNDKAYFKKAHHDLGRAAQKLQQKINTFEQWKRHRSWFRNAKGQFGLPILGGRIVRGFGKKTHPRFHTVTMHRGMDMVPGRNNNRKIRAIFMGKVVYAGWLRGYGNTVIIDHTKNDYTLYGHLKKMNVVVGDIVETRQMIGLLGSSGSLTGERLYFELRLNGEPENPVPWFNL